MTAFQDKRSDSSGFVVIYALISSILAVAIGSLASYGLTRFKYVYGGKLRNRELSFYFISQRILPPVAIVIPLFILFQTVKLFDTQIGLIIAYTAFNLPIVVWLMQDYFAGIPVELEESAYIDGCSRFGAFWRITLPNIKWGLLYGVILCNARAMGEFGAVSVVSGHIRGQTNTVPLHVEVLYNEYQSVAAFAVASLLALLALVTLVIKTVAQWRHEREMKAIASLPPEAPRGRPVAV